MNQTLNKTTAPDYFVAQFPGGGQRGYATVKLLEWLEKETELPTHQLFPYVTTGSVGILIASALYLPHPEHPNAARMSARQLATIFPDIAARTPTPARFKNTNSREPFAEAIEPFIGHGKLKDFLGTVFFSSHQIGRLSESYIIHGKLVSPTTGETSYVGDPEKRILDIAFAGTSLPSLFQAYEDQIDLAFSEVPSETMVKIQRLFPHDATGAFVRVGNFRSKTEKSRAHLHSSGYLRQTLSFAITDAVSDHAYSQTVSFANTLFNGLVYNLEYEIGSDYPDPPQIMANITTEAQFKKIELMSEKFIADNILLLTDLAHALKTSALARMRIYPDTAFGVLPKIQEFPLSEIKALSQDTKSTRHMFSVAAGRLTKELSAAALYSLNSAFEVATSEPVKAFADQIKTVAEERLSRWGAILLPNTRPKNTEATLTALPPPIDPNQELL